MSSLPLAGKCVIELGTMLAAPFAAHILSQMGAEVVKVEPPRGDPTRCLVRGGPSGTFIAYSHGKKSVCIDLSSDAGHAAFSALLATADILIHNLAPRAAARLRVTPEACKAINPHLVYCHIRGYAAGPQEDDLASNPVAEAATGVMENHCIDGRPSRLGPSYHDQFAGAYAVIGILSAVLQAQAGLSPGPIEIGLYETGLHVASRDLVGMQLKTQLLGHPEREPNGEFSMPGYGAYLTSDQRWLYLLMLTDGHWAKFCTALDLPQANDDSLRTLRQRKKTHQQVEDIVRTAIAALSFDEITSRLKFVGVGSTEVLPLERVLDCPQAQHPGKLRHVRFRDLDFQVPEFPAAGGISITTSSLPPRDLGADTLEVLQAAGLTLSDCEQLLAQGVIAEAQPDRFAWAPVRRQTTTAP